MAKKHAVMMEFNGVRSVVISISCFIPNTCVNDTDLFYIYEAIREYCENNPNFIQEIFGNEHKNQIDKLKYTNV